MWYKKTIQPLISDDTSLFIGVVRKRTRRIVLSNVRVDKPHELVSGAVKSYGENKYLREYMPYNNNGQTEQLWHWNLLFFVLLFMIRLLSWNMSCAIYGTPYLQTLLLKELGYVYCYWTMVKSYFDSFTEDFHISVVHTISNSCSNSSKGSGGTAIFIIKTKGLKNFEIKNDRICDGILSNEGYQDICVLCTILPSTNY